MAYSYCPYCARELGADQVCGHCGQRPETYEPLPHHFPAGTVLDRRYWVGRVLGEGGFGITYLGFDAKLQRRVAIKEYFPSAMVQRDNGSTQVTCYTRDKVQYDKGKNQFLEEARVLALVDNIPEVVRVMDFFPANGTAYIVMEFLEGETLKQRLKKNGPMEPDKLIAMLDPLMKALDKVHKTGLIHRDISPDNIMLLNDEDQVKLMDFGCARDSSSGLTMTVMLKPGFAPFEQYSGKEQGPWTDIYALCATLYYAMTGKLPPNAMDRMDQDTILPPSALGVTIQPAMERALMKGLSVRVSERWQSVYDLRKALTGEIITEVRPPVPQPPMPEPPKPEPPKSEPPKPQPPVQEKLSPVPPAEDVHSHEGYSSTDAEKKKFYLKIGIIAAVALLLCIYFGTYMSASSSAEKGDFEKAEKMLILPAITQLHDEKLVDYIEAGNLLEKGQYVRAVNALSQLSRRGYAPARGLLNEANYQWAMDLADDRKYEDAVNLLSELSQNGYGPAEEALNEVKFQWAMDRAEDGDHLIAYSLLVDLDGYSDSERELDDLTKTMYREAQSLYREGYYDDAKAYFEFIPSHSDSDKYLTLLEARTCEAYGTSGSTDAIVKKLKTMLDFEDASEVVLLQHSVARDFLHGRWEGGGYYFEIDDKGYGRYTLPWFEFGDYYRFEKGQYLLYPDGDFDNTKPMFTFTVLSVDSIQVFCHKDGVTRTLHRVS